MKEKELKENISKAEGMLCGLILKCPDYLCDYNINMNLLSDDALLYIGVANILYKKGIENIDEVSIANEIDNLGLKSKYDRLGGWQTVKELMAIINENNAAAIYNEWTKWNLVKSYCNKGILDLDLHWDKIVRMTAQQLVDYLEYQIVDSDIHITNDIDFEVLDLTDREIQDLQDGINVGLQYGKHSPILNYLSLGLPKSDLTLFASYTNGGKSSFVTSNILIPLAEQKKKGVLIANEQQSIVYKLLLQIYVLTERLGYYKITRKKLKSGQWTTEDKNMIEKARKIIKEEYSPYITFTKIYDYDMKKVNKIAKRGAKRGAEYILYDTMKYSGEDESVWLSLIDDSKQLFQCCSKLGLSGIVTCQLAPSTKNKMRILDESCLSNAKQIAEVFSEMFAFRDIWSDEFNGCDADIKPYRFKKVDGKFTSEREEIKLDKTKKYKIFFHFKTRNDESGKTILYEFQGHINKWKELGYCTVNGRNR